MPAARRVTGPRRTKAQATPPDLLPPGAPLPRQARADGYVGLAWNSPDGLRRVTAYSDERHRLVIETGPLRRASTLAPGDLERTVHTDQAAWAQTQPAAADPKSRRTSSEDAGPSGRPPRRARRPR